MRLETFFEKFELFADAPNVVAKLRELVLQLACSGRIADQVVTDQPATELLSEIFSVRDRFLKDGKGKSRVEGSMITAGDTMDIPSTWTRCMIAEVCDLQTGATPSRQESTYFGGNIPWLVSGDINRGEIFECDGRITDSGFRNSNCKVIPQNSVLIALNGQGKTRATVALLRIEAALNQSLVAMIPYSRERLLPEYLFWNLRGRYYAIRDITGQDQRRGLNMKLVGQLSLPVPPLAEQKRIVAKVDELMALCDQLEAQQQERGPRHAALARASLACFAEAPTPANLGFLFHQSYPITPADLRKTILTLAVQGKLVPQDHNDEPAITDLDEIQTEKTALIEARKLRPNRVTEIFQTQALQYDVPDSWRWFRLGDVAFFQEGPGIRNWQFRTQGIKLLNVQNIVDDRLVLENTDRHISTEEFQSTYRHFAVETGDILFASSGASWGKTAWFEDPGYTVMLNTSMVRLKFYSKRCDDAFLLLFLRTEFFKTQMELQLVGIQPNFGSTHLGRVYIPLPPLVEQRRIVAKVDQLMAHMDNLETQLTASRATADKLMEAVVSGLVRNGEGCEHEQEVERRVTQGTKVIAA
jgi:type I restriction enzyme S subunit